MNEPRTMYHPCGQSFIVREVSTEYPTKTIEIEGSDWKKPWKDASCPKCLGIIKGLASREMFDRMSELPSQGRMF